MIFHIDGNSFYAACERVYRPDLAHNPIAVLSNNDGHVHLPAAFHQIPEYVVRLI